MANPITRALRRLVGRSLESGTPGVEGQPKEGPWLINTGANQGWLPAEWGQYSNFWQMDLDPVAGGTSAVVQACVAAYAQTIAMCPGDHWRLREDGGRDRVTNSALSRILRRPNDYQSRSDFILNLARDLYLHGNTYALAVRNDRYEVSALHSFDPKKSQPVVGANGEIFYELRGNNLVERQFFGAGGTPFYSTSRGVVAPARDVLHVKLEAQAAEPLVGIPPLRHASASIAAQNAIGKQLVNVFANMGRPAGVIESEVALTNSQTKDYGTSFNEAWRGINDLGGRPPILPPGLKFKGISMTAKDTELAAVAKLTQDEIFMVYGVPPAILGMTDKGSFASTEALMQFWLARGLGFAINHIEVAIDHFFGLRGWPDEYTELDTRALLRVAYKDRIEALARGVQTAIYTPNEARRAEDLPDKDGGNEPRVQQQQVPLDWGGFDMQPTPPQQPSAPGEPPPAQAPADDDEAEPDEAADDRDWQTFTFTKMTSHAQPPA
jgi:HK97 family phage portal protein